MLASYNWLRSLLPGLSASVEEVGERLTRSGLEIEELREYGAASPKVRIAQVVAIDKHPNRERLKLVTVATGEGEQVVVCGANNVPEPGGKVAFAPTGTHLPAVDMTLTPRKIGGVESCGMLCSELELGLVAGTGKGDGIMVFAPEFEAAAGVPLSEAIPASHDWVLDIGVTPNRPDALGHMGLARELAALFGMDFAPPPIESPLRIAEGVELSQLASVQIDELERCPHYGAAVLLGLKVQTSPTWLRYRLESLGVRAISNVVDVTNLVLLEYGQPLHAFDIEKLDGGQIEVRCAHEGESFTTLDGVERKLVADDLLIASGGKGVALAGVMGGADSEVGETTESLLLECAYFLPRGVRRTARRHALHSEASHRFERGCDPRCVPDVLAHTAALLTQICGAKAVASIVLAGSDPAEPTRITLRRERMVGLLGVDIDWDEAAAILARLGCVLRRHESRPDELDVEAPSYRPDLSMEEDLIEEVMRVHGIDRLPTRLRAVEPCVGRSSITLENQVRQTAAQLGLSETLTYGFVAPSELAALAAEPGCVHLLNPLTEERSVMRTSMLPGLLEGLRRARRHSVLDVRLFGVGRTFHAPSEGALPEERVQFAAVLAGSRSLGLEKPVELDIYDCKGVAVELVERVLRRPVEVRRGKAAHLHPRGAAELYVAETCVGRFGPLHPDVCDTLDLEGSCFVMELELGAMAAVGAQHPQYKPIPTLPASSRDLAFVVTEDVAAGSVAQAIQEAAGSLCESVNLFDLYQGKGLPDGHLSLAYHLIFRDPKAASDPENARTLTDKEVDALTKKAIVACEQKFAARVR